MLRVVVHTPRVVVPQTDKEVAWVLRVKNGFCLDRNAPSARDRTRFWSQEPSIESLHRRESMATPPFPTACGCGCFPEARVLAAPALLVVGGVFSL